jgi:anthranilate 3-monooxygenase (FAD) / 4-hydroxyphenylacetate 3-monooxygenase
MGVRTGEEFIRHLKAHPREVWLRGRRIDDVTEEPAFEKPIKQLAHLFDMQHDPQYADTLTYQSPTSGDPVATAFMPSRSYDDLVKRRKGFQLWAEATFGLMGRSQDYMNATLLAFAEARHLFAEAGEQFGDNIVNYYEFIRENDLFLTHAIVSPQTDRSKSSAEQTGDHLHLGVVRETGDGIIVRGARMLATLGPIADEILVYNLPGLQPQDAAHALVFGLPVDAPGLRQMCREPFDEGGRSSFDHPLASNFEESDTLMIFDDVLVPWERVFLYNQVDLSNAVFPQTFLRNYSAHQTCARGLVKMQFAVGLAMAVSEAVKSNGFLHVQEMFGECLEALELIKGCMTRAEIEFETTERGAVLPLYQPLQAVRTFMPRAYPKVIEVLQKVGAGGLLMMPSAADLTSPVGAEIERFYQGADGLAGTDRIRLYKLAWDLCGDSFGSRQLQYERYYAGDPVRSTAANYVNFDKSESQELVKRALELAGEP